MSGRPKLEEVSEYDQEAERLLGDYAADGVTVNDLSIRYGLSVNQVSRRLARARKNRSSGMCETCGRRL